MSLVRAIKEIEKAAKASKKPVQIQVWLCSGREVQGAFVEANSYHLCIERELTVVKTQNGVFDIANAPKAPQLVYLNHNCIEGVMLCPL